MSKRDVEVLREYVRRVLGEKRKPGGPITKMGAQRIINPDKFETSVRSAVDGARGDVDKSADALDVSPRTLYHYLDTEPALSDVETTDDLEGDGKSTD